MPTFNRVRCLEQLLQSIRLNAPQCDVLVLDNASDDGTEHFMRSLAHAGRVRYDRNTVNRGAIANLLDVVAKAQSEWVLIMSDDDVLRMDLDFIDSIDSDNVDAILLGRCDGDAELNFLRDWPYIDASATGHARGAAYTFRTLAELFDAGRCLGAAFTLISGVVVRREAWLRSEAELRSGPCAQEYARSLFPHSWIIINLMKHGSAVVVKDQPVVMARHGNDRVCDNNVLGRALLDIREFESVASTLLQSDRRAAAGLLGLVGRHIQNHVFPRAFAAIYQRARYGATEWALFSQRAVRYLTFAQRTFPSLIPYPVLKQVYRFYRRFVA
ncbi:glycosyltransferase family 2 protein [Paraburkholderia xenovorans]